MTYEKLLSAPDLLCAYRPPKYSEKTVSGISGTTGLIYYWLYHDPISPTTRMLRVVRRISKPTQSIGLWVG